MSETITADAAETGTEATEETQHPKPSETVDFWKQKAREQERRAKENADAARRLAEIEESQKSAEQKSADRVRQLEDELTASRRDSLRFKVASEFGIPADRAELLLTGSDEATMRRQAEAIKGDSDERKKRGNHVPREGNNPTPASDEMREFTRGLFGRAD